MLRLVLLAITLCVPALSACSSGRSEETSPDKYPLVFIHGIKGSELQTKDGEIRWLTALQALGFSTPDIALAPRFERGVQPAGGLVPGRILETIPIVPYLFEVDVYGPWLETASKMQRPFYPFSYDWRRDNNETAAMFERFLETVAARHGAGGRGKVVVVAHSMGGLVTLAVLNRRTDLVHRVVFAGVPFSGGIGFLPDLHVGMPTGLNAEIAGRRTLATFPSIFSLFPRGSGHLVDAHGQPIEADFYAPQDWERLGLGMFAGGEQPEAGYREFLAEALGRARAFRDRLIPRVVTYPPALVVASRAHKTLVQAMKDGPKSVSGWDFASAATADGDGRVAFRNTMPPLGIPYDVVETPAGHAELLNDGAVIEKVRAFLDAGDPALSFP